jgi:DNA-binding beta-propeller fold protein YncE
MRRVMTSIWLLIATAASACASDDDVVLRAFVPNAGDGTVTAIDAERLDVLGTVVVNASGSTSHGVAVHRDGARFFVGDVDRGLLKAYDTVTLAPLAEIDLGIRVHGIDITPDGSRVIVSGARLADPERQMTYLIGTADLTVLATIDADFSGHATTTPDGRYAYVTDIVEHRLGIVDLSANRMVHEITVGPEIWPDDAVGPNQVTFSPDGSTAWTADYGAQGLSVLDTSEAGKPEVVGFIPLGDLPHGIEVTRDGREIWVANRGSADVAILDAASGAELQRVSTAPYEANHVALTPDGARAFITLTASAHDADPRGELLVLDAVTRAEVGRITLGITPHEVSFD